MAGYDGKRDILLDLMHNQEVGQAYLLQLCID